MFWRFFAVKIDRAFGFRLSGISLSSIDVAFIQGLARSEGLIQLRVLSSSTNTVTLLIGNSIPTNISRLVVMDWKIYFIVLTNVDLYLN